MNPPLLCVECYKRGTMGVLAEYIHFGKSVCSGCVVGSIEVAREMVAEIEKFKAFMDATSQESASVSARMNLMMDRMEQGKKEGSA